MGARGSQQHLGDVQRFFEQPLNLFGEIAIARNVGVIKSLADVGAFIAYQGGFIKIDLG